MNRSCRGLLRLRFATIMNDVAIDKQTKWQTQRGQERHNVERVEKILCDKRTLYRERSPSGSVFESPTLSGYCCAKSILVP